MHFRRKAIPATTCSILGRIVHLQTALRSQWDKCQKNNSLFASPSICRPTISRLILPLSVSMPLRSKALATAPIWIVGSRSIPCSLKERCSQCSAIPNCSLVALIVSAKSLRHILAFSLLFQSVLSVRKSAGIYRKIAGNLRLTSPAPCGKLFLCFLRVKKPANPRTKKEENHENRNPMPPRGLYPEKR